MKVDVCIIGAGPAGMTAAIFAAGSGVRTVLIEKNTSTGNKLLRTARGRCNITHAGSINDFVKIYGKSGRFVKHGLYEFSPQKLMDFFGVLGVKIVSEPSGCCYPESNRASDVKQALERAVKDAGCSIMFGREVGSLSMADGHFVIRTDKQTVSAKSVIISTGGVSYPGTGSTGDGYRFASELGHRIVEPRPALIRLVSVQRFPAVLQGSAVADVVLTAKPGGTRIVASGPMIFTEDGIGGPGVFDLSRLITDYLPGDVPVPVTVDMCPQKDRSELEEFLVTYALKHPRKIVSALLSDFLCAKIARQVCLLSGISDDLKAANFSRKQRVALVNNIKSLSLDIISTGPVEKAIVTKGGTALDEIESKTMQSKLRQGLFFAGEVIDADGPCGGYNLQLAFSTGSVAGVSAANFIGLSSEQV